MPSSCGCGMLRTLTLSLSGLQRPSPSVARALGKHRGVLILDGLKDISDEAKSRNLAIVSALFELNGLRSLVPPPQRPWLAVSASGPRASCSIIA